MASIAANLEGLEALFDAAELGQYVPSEYAGIAADVETQFARAKTALDQLSGDVEADLASDAGRAALGEVIGATQELQRLFGEELPAALGLSVGFSSLDGD
jgi:predicted lipoprotein